MENGIIHWNIQVFEEILRSDITEYSYLEGLEGHLGLLLLLLF